MTATAGQPGQSGGAGGVGGGGGGGGQGGNGNGLSRNAATGFGLTALTALLAIIYAVTTPMTQRIDSQERLISSLQQQDRESALQRADNLAEISAMRQQFVQMETLLSESARRIGELEAARVRYGDRYLALIAELETRLEVVEKQSQKGP